MAEIGGVHALFMVFLQELEWALREKLGKRILKVSSLDKIKQEREVL